MSEMSTWGDLARELDAWGEAGRVATLWWRDDDATAVTPQLERLLALTSELGIVPALAVIPARAEPALAARLMGTRAAVLQHGFAHRNHAPDQAKKAELGAHRAVAQMTRELARGWRRLRQLFPPSLPVLVPPWNRVAEALLPALPAVGFDAVSCFGPRAAARDDTGLEHVNTHVDPVAWRSGRGYCGDALALPQVIGHLRARRAALTDSAEPTGLMTHHLVQDEATWAFCERLARVTGAHPAARWLRAHDVFCAP